MTDEEVLIIVFSIVTFILIGECLYFYYIRNNNINNNINHIELSTSNPVNDDCTIPQ